MTKHDYIRMGLMFVSYIIFLPIAYLIWGNSGATFIAIIAGCSVSLVFQIVVSFAVPEKGPEKDSYVLGISITDTACIYYILQLIISFVFLILLHFGISSLSTVITIDCLLLVATLICVLLPEPKEITTTSAFIYKGTDPDSLSGTYTYLEKIAHKSESPALSNTIADFIITLKKIDPTLTQGIQAIETELGNICVAAEEAVSHNDGTKIALLTKKITAIKEKYEGKIASAVIASKDDSFYYENDDIAESLIDSLLDDLNIENEEDIVKSEYPIEDDIRYIKALRFASEEYRQILQKYNQTIIDRRISEKQAKIDNEKQKKSLFTKIIYGAYTFVLIGAVGVLITWTTLISPGGYSYTVNEDGTLTITDYNMIYGDEIEIPSEICGKTVTIIGKHAFDGKNISSMKIPGTVTTIEYEALRDMTSLHSLYIPISVTTIGAYSVHNNIYMTTYYEGSEEDWLKIEIGRYGNNQYENNVKYNSYNS